MHLLKKITFVLWLIPATVVTNAQKMITIQGMVLDETSKPLPGCHIHMGSLCCITNNIGVFSHDFIAADTLIRVQISFIGYEKFDTIFSLSNQNLLIQLKPEATELQSVFIHGMRVDTLKTLKNEIINKNFITQNLSSTFIKSIEKLPGINSMDIGAGASKPVIRGLGFNRVVVSENGIKQEGQQWGVDHGLELDPFTIETAEIVKGPSAIKYGSDAIGGYININNDYIPEKGTLSGELSLLGKTINNNLAGSILIQGRHQKFFFKLRGTVFSFGDYKIPTDTIIYLTRKIPVYNNTLKNTSGQEYDWFNQMGFIGKNFKTTVTFSQVNQKSGFFPGAHGVPDLDRVNDDGDYRNIDFPYQVASHLKILSNSKIFFPHGILNFDLAFQNNVREEWSEFHTHYPGQQPPEENSNQEFFFNLKTYQLNTSYTTHYLHMHQISMGIQNQWKNNTIAGYNYLLPTYSNFSTGVFLNDKFEISEQFNFNVGLRYDFTQTEIISYFDTIVYDYFSSTLQTEIEPFEYALRTNGLVKHYQDISWIAGFLWKPENQMVLRLNIGKAFRAPTPIELASNGIHHGSFRHEKGDSTLISEKGYYSDISFEYSKTGFFIGINPYIYYFSNYIFLRPTGNWSFLPHAGQIYQYTETPALLSGVELSIKKPFLKIFLVETNLEYIYNKQLNEDFSKQYPLPLTPPINSYIGFEYLFSPNSQRFNSKFLLNCQFALAQNNIARNEISTPGYIIFGAGFSSRIKSKRGFIDLVLKANNLFNTKYFNHISFYRKINIPEPGRNIQVTVKMPINLIDTK